MIATTTTISTVTAKAMTMAKDTTATIQSKKIRKKQIKVAAAVIAKPRQRSRSQPPTRLEWPARLPTSTTTTQTAAAAAAKTAKAAKATKTETEAVAANMSMPLASTSSPRPVASASNKRSQRPWTFPSPTTPATPTTTTKAKQDATPRRRRPRTAAATKNTVKTATIIQKPPCESRLWADVHAPSTLDALCVAPKKVKEIVAWLQQSSASTQLTSISSNPSTNRSSRMIGGGGGGVRLLILVGSPGIGKSTCVRLLAQELHFNLLEWTESVTASTSSLSSTSTYLHPDLLSQPSPLDSFESFLQQARRGYTSIQTTIVNARHPQEHHQPSQSTTPALILLDELPNLHGADMEARFRNMITTHVMESITVPTILIWSQVTEGKHHKEDLERLIDPTILYNRYCPLDDGRNSQYSSSSSSILSPFCHTMVIHPPTQARFHKIITSVIHQHKIPTLRAAEKGKVVHRHEYALDTSSLYEESGGDVRFAINSLQFLLGQGAGNHATTRTSHDHPQHQRDQRLHPMHALGKLLHAKRTNTSFMPPKELALLLPPRWQDSRPSLEFDPPESVVERCCDMDPFVMLQFLQYHAVERVTDSNELSDIMSCYSDAAWLFDSGGSTDDYSVRGSSRRAGQSLSSSSSGIAPIRLSSLAASLLSRALAAHNLHPAPSNKFRPLSKPAIFEVMSKRSRNQGALRHQCQIIEHQSGAFQWTSIHVCAVDYLSYMRKIFPSAHSHSYGDGSRRLPLVSLESYVAPQEPNSDLYTSELSWTHPHGDCRDDDFGDDKGSAMEMIMMLDEDEVDEFSEDD